MSRLHEFWPGVFAHSSGGLWLAESSTLILADLHLGYGWAQRRKGQLGPLVDHETSSKVTQVLDELNPFKLLLAGDIVHAPRPAGEEFQFIETTLTGMAARAELVCLKGNHDRHFDRDFAHLNIPLLEEWTTPGIRVVHGDRLPSNLQPGERLVIGHLHPAIGLEDAAGVTRRIPAFLIAGNVAVLPAFSPFAAGLNVWGNVPKEIEELSGGARAEAIAATGTRVANLGPLDRLRSPASGSRPRNYRGSK